MRNTTLKILVPQSLILKSTERLILILDQVIKSEYITSFKKKAHEYKKRIVKELLIKIFHKTILQILFV